MIDFSHGLAMYERAPNTVEPLWVEGAGHNDVELYGQYLDRLRKFVQREVGQMSRGQSSTHQPNGQTPSDEGDSKS